MTPMQGQGANMSIEDAEAFRLLASGTKREDVPGILKLVESVRRPRTTKVVEETRKTHGNLRVTERVTRNLDENCGYDGVFEALRKVGREGEVEN